MLRKRIIAVSIAAMMMVGMFAGCGKSNTEGTSSSSTSAASTQPVKTYTIKMFGMRINPNPDSEVMKLFNSKLGGNTLEVSSVPDTDYLPKLQLLMAAQDLPDIFVSSNQTVLEKGTAKFTEDDYKKYMPDIYNSAIKQYNKTGYTKEYAFSLNSVDNKLAGISFGQVPNTLTYGFAVRTDMLTTLGKTMPKTIADWDGVFKAYKQKYPDKYPITARGKDWLSGSFRWFLGAYGVTFDGWQMKDGKLTFGPFMPEMRDALAQLQKWYKDGYINPEWVTMDNKAYNNEFINGNTMFLQAQNLIVNTATKPYIAGGTFDLAAAKDPNMKTEWAPYPVAKEGTKFFYPVFRLINSVCVSFGSHLEKDKDKLHAAMDVLNKSMSKEMYILRIYGIEGKTFDYVDGVPVVKKDLNNDDAMAKNGFGWMGALTSVGIDWDMQQSLYQKNIQDQLKTLLDDTKGIYGKNNVASAYTDAPGVVASKSGEDLGVRGKAKDDQWKTIFSEVVIGRKSLDDFDKFIAEWKKEVGDDKIEAMNRLYAKDWMK